MGAIIARMSMGQMGVPVGSSLDIRPVVQEKFADLDTTEKARTMKGSTAAAKYGIRKMNMELEKRGRLEARVCKGSHTIGLYCERSPRLRYNDLSRD